MQEQNAGRAGARAFVTGAAVLSLAGIISKVLGMLYRVPLSNVLGTEGMGVYQMAYPVYQTLVSISTAGLPAAISQLVARNLAADDAHGAKAVFTVALKLLTWMGVISTAIMLLGAPLIARVIGDAAIWPTIMMLSPSLLFVAIICAYRGYFQGMQRMMPTAVSQVIEQGGKLVVGLVLAILFIKKGVVIAAAMGLLGATAAEGMAMLWMMFVHRRMKAKGELAALDAPPSRPQIPARQVLEKLLMVAVPITLGALAMPLVYSVDAIIVNNLLRGMGYTVEAARSAYGALTNDAQTLVNMPAVVTVALSMSLVPAVASAMAQKSRYELNRRVRMGLKIAVMVGLPASVGLMLLAKPFIGMLYASHTPEEIELGARLTVTLAPSLFFLALMQTGNAVLQGMGRVNAPVKNLLAGAVVKVVWDLSLVSKPGINVYGAAMATTACYATVAILNIVCILRYGRGAIKLHWRDALAPVVSTAAMAGVVVLVYKGVGQVLKRPTIGSLAAVAVGVVVYAVLIFALGAISRDELDMIPGGRHLARFVRR
nr:polysaccharide biosynthesis protein [bacterium]